MSRVDGDPKQARSVTSARAAPQRAWVCGYAELGQCCEAGPTRSGCCSRSTSPCIPRPSHWYRRSALRINLAIFTGGALLLALLLPSREKHFVPGELSSKHAQILENTLVAERCGLCHVGSHAGDQAGTRLAAFANGLQALLQRPLDSSQQDALCMQCHRGHMPNAASGSPHDLTDEMWLSVTGAASRSREVGSTRCAACHSEHHGRGYDLKQLADDRCQACHRRQFRSFSLGHPEFVDFPRGRPAALSFSHQLHADKHFPQKGQAFDCRQCHADANATTGSAQISRSLSFEKACAQCHQEPIRAAVVAGWAALELPSIDAEAATRETGLDHWPAGARFGFEGVISPVLRALLAADPAAQGALAELPQSGRLTEIPNRENGRREATLTLARATQRLLSETARDGQSAWRARLKSVTRARLGRELTPADDQLIEAMCAGLPPDLFRQIYAKWFERGSGSSANTQAGDEGLSNRNAASARLVAAGDDDLLLTSPENQLGDASATTSADDLLLGGSDKSADASLDGDLAGDANAAPQHAPALHEALPLKGAVHVSSGGWYIDDRTLAVRYMPTGHADATLAAWNLWWKVIESSSAIASEQPSLAEQIPGGCLECHRLDGRATGAIGGPRSLAERWKIATESPARKEFIKFNHAPHLSLPAVNDCRYCHVLPAQASSVSPIDAPAQLLERLTSTGSSHGSEFRSMQLSQCVACHRPDGANTSCLQCHNYHVNSIGEDSPGR